MTGLYAIHYNNCLFSFAPLRAVKLQNGDVTLVGWYRNSFNLKAINSMEDTLD